MSQPVDAQAVINALADQVRNLVMQNALLQAQLDAAARNAAEPVETPQEV